MTTIWDKHYKATKLIKQGSAHLTSPFAELAQWIASKWQVTVLNIIYDPGNSLHAPRLRIILERETENKKFHSGFDFDSEKQRTIKDKWLMLLSRDEAANDDLDGLFVVFSAFDRLAREEADSQISKDELNALKDRIANPDLWEIDRCFGHVTFFFYTAAQVRRYATEGKKPEYSKMYFEILKRYDEFGYLDEREFTIAFDSKENFDDNYYGSWFNYHR